MMMVSELAEVCGVTAETVRYYVRVGLLQPRYHPDNNYKFFEPDDVHKVRFIKQAKLLGYTLSEINQILHHSELGDSPCPLVRDLIQSRIEANRVKLKELAALQKRMEEALEEWEDKPDGLPDGNSICHLIESFIKEP